MAKRVAKPRAAKVGMDAQSKREPKKPSGSVAKPKILMSSAVPRKIKVKPDTLATAVASLYDTATEIVADRLQPTIDQIKALAQAVIGHAERKARKAQAKADGSGKAKKPNTAKAASRAEKPKKKKK